MFLKIDPRNLDRFVNFKILKTFLYRRPVFPDYLSVSYDYDDKEDVSYDVESLLTNIPIKDTIKYIIKHIYT